MTAVLRSGNGDRQPVTCDRSKGQLTSERKLRQVQLVFDTSETVAHKSGNDVVSPSKRSQSNDSTLLEMELSNQSQALILAVK